MRIGRSRDSGGDELTPPFRHARPIPLTRLYPVPRARRVRRDVWAMSIARAFSAAKPIVRFASNESPMSPGGGTTTARTESPPATQVPSLVGSGMVWMTGSSLSMMIGLVGLTMAIIQMLPLVTLAVPAPLAAIGVVTLLATVLPVSTTGLSTPTRVNSIGSPPSGWSRCWRRCCR
jgi:hypothetical protein